MTIERLMVLVCAIASFDPTSGACYNYKIVYKEGNDVLTKNIYPITKFPEGHAYVKATNAGKPICGMEVKAGDLIPGTKAASKSVSSGEWSSYSSKDDVPMWSTAGETKRERCMTTTACLDQRNSYEDCKTNGFISSGVAWYAYNEPQEYSANTGHEQPDTALLYFVASEDEETSLVIVHDKPYDNSFGKVKWRIKVQHQSKADEKVFLVLRDDQGVLHSDSSTCAAAKGNVDDCYSWNWDQSKRLGEGIFYQKWGVCCTDGMVMGPMPSERFTMEIQYLERIGIEHFKIGSLEYDSNGKAKVTFTSIDIGTIKEGITVEGYTCDAFCASYASCGECTAKKDCGWCSDGKGGGKCEFADPNAVKDKKKTCESRSSSSVWTAPLTCCNNKCGQHSACGDCLKASDCGWCQSTNKCISGNENGVCAASGKQCPALKDVAPYESREAFVHDKCPCDLKLPTGFEAGGDCEDLDSTFCAQAITSSKTTIVRGQAVTAAEACCKYGGGDLQHQNGCIKWTNDDLKAKCNTNMHIFPNVHSAKDCLSACAKFQGCLLWTFSSKLECAGCLSKSGADSMQRLKDAGKYRIGTNTCKKGCFAGSKLKSGNTCLAKCEQGFQSSSNTVAREYTCDAGQLSSSPETLRCVPKPCNADALDISTLARDDFTKGDCEGKTVPHGQSCLLGCAEGFNKPSIQVPAKCEKGKWHYNAQTQSVCRELRCEKKTISDLLDKQGRVGINRQGIAGCSASTGLDGGQECYVTCKRGFSSEDGSTYGKITCTQGTPSRPNLKCTEIKCDTTQLKTGGNFPSQRADGIATSSLKFEQKVSFKCKEGYAIEDGSQLNDEQLCDSTWNPAFVPQHNDKCKEIKCPTNDINSIPGQVILDKDNKAITGNVVVKYSEAVKVECKSPSHYAVGAASDRIQCTAFDSFKKIPSIQCEPVRCDIAALKLAPQTQVILSSKKSGFVEFQSSVTVGCAPGYYNSKTSVSVQCNSLTSFSDFDSSALPCKPITCNIGDLKLSAGAVVKEMRRFTTPIDASTVRFDESVILGCGAHNGLNYFSKTEEDYQIELKCDAYNGFKDKTGAELKCEKCTDVVGCKVAETCTTATNSKCAECSDMGNSKHAYRKIGTGSNKATQCKKCGQPQCGANTEEKLLKGSKECDGKGETNPYTCTNCNLILNCEEQDPADCNTCIRCKDGFYNDQSKPNKCLACLKSSAGATGGAKFIPNCINGVCKSGSDVKCVVCPEGFYIGSDGSCAECQKCKKGERLVEACTGRANTDDKLCQKCPQGTFSDTANAATCTLCPDTSTTDPSALAASRDSCFCRPGFSVADKKCIPCNANKYMSERSTVFTNKKCSECPKHSSTNEGTQVDDVARCECQAGYFFSKAQEDATHVCTPCGSNTYKGKSNDPKCRNCRDGSETLDTAPFTSEMECECKKGFGAPSAGQTCAKCPKNYFKDSVASKPCTACPAKSTTDNEGSTASTDCKCSKGYFHEGNTCKICPAGKYADQRGQHKCKDCPAGSTTRAFDKKWTTIKGAVSLSQCICQGGYKKVEESGAGHSCVACTIGTFAQENAANCEQCPQDSTTKSDAAVNKQDCLCVKGYTVRKGRCKMCDRGSFADSLGSRRCDICEENTNTADKGSASKDECECNPGYMLAPNSSAVKCSVCPANSYKKSSGDAKTCTACPAHSSTAGVTGAASVAACLCDPGFYFVAGQDGGAHTCVACGVDTYKDTYGNDKACQSCREHSSSEGKTNLKSVDGCLCKAGFFLYESRICEACDRAIPNCDECKPRIDTKESSNPAVCTQVSDAYKINKVGVVEPQSCGSEFEFGNDVIPSEVDLSHCLASDPATGILCQPRCKSKYQTTTPLPEWKDYKKQYCKPGGASANVELKKMDHRKCQQYCESLPDCFYFASHTQGTACDIWRTNEKCDLVSGSNSQFQPFSVWWKYEGKTDLGFAFVCNGDGKWRANGYSDKDSATKFFAGQCELAPTTTTTTTTNIPVVDDTETNPETVHPVIVVFGAAGIVAVLVVIIVLLTRKNKEEEPKPPRQTVDPTPRELEKVMSTPTPKGEEGDEEEGKAGTDHAFDVVDDVPT